MSLPAEAAPPARDTVRVGALEIDRAPVTNGRYAAFVAATVHRAPAYWPRGECPASLRDHPVVGVDFFDAMAFALWAKGRLPTEREWVLASGLAAPSAYVWGNDFEASRCNTVRSGQKGTTPVGAFAGGVAPSGCVDLCGNVWEMTCTPYPRDEESVIVKGGSWYDYPAHARLETRFRARVHRAGNTVGFRLVYGGPVGLPAFLGPDLVARCIAHRRTATAIAADDEASPEFDDVLSELRSEAAEMLPGLEAPLDDDLGDVEEILGFFDAADRAPLPPAGGDAPRDKTQALERLEGILDRVHAFASAHPRALMGALAAAVLLVATLLWGSASADSDRGRARSTEVALRDAPDPELVRHAGGPIMIVKEAPPARTGGAGSPRAAEQHEPMTRMPPPDQAMADILQGSAEKREEGERYFIDHPEIARDRVEWALTAEIDAEAKASLRYVLAALEESVPAAGSPEAVSAPPREGLVFFVDKISGTVSEGLAMVRRTAKAEGLPLTVVYAGDGDGYALLDTHGHFLTGTRYYVDRDRRLARRLGTTGTPAVAGLDADGRVAFLHVGPLERAALAQKVTTLQR